MPTLLSRSLLAAVIMLGALPALAQENERTEFAGGVLTITETEDMDRVLAYDGRELARDYFVHIDQIADVAGTEVAFVSVGPGGNACAPGTLMLWKDADGKLQTQKAGEECDAPTVAVSDYGVFFIRYLLPGESADMMFWSPDEGMKTFATTTYTPDPGSGWETLDLGKIGHPIDLFRNAGVYAAAQKLLGDELSTVVTSLVVSGEPDLSGSLLSARGCVPHACGSADGFIVVDKAAKAIFIAQMGEDGVTRFWPDRGRWPDAAAALLPQGF